MISLNYAEIDAEIEAMVRRFGELPRHIARKHLGAAMRNAVKQSRGIQVLKSLTPKAKTITERSGDKRKGGELRKSVTVKTVAVRNASSVFAVLGYKFSDQSRKAIWMEYGTRRGVRSQRMAEKAFQRISGTVKSVLASNLAASLEKSVNELAGGKNPGRAG